MQFSMVYDMPITSPEQMDYSHGGSYSYEVHTIRV